MEYIDSIKEKLIKCKDIKKIKVVSGLNQIDKTKILKLMKDYLIESGIEEENILCKDYREDFFSILPQTKVFFEDIKDYIRGKGKCYLLLSNVDQIEDFDKVLNNLILGYNVDVYIASDKKIEGKVIDINVLPTNEDINPRLSFLEVENSYRILNKELFYHVAKYIFENIGRTFSINELCTHLKKQKIKVNVEGVYNYVKYLEESYLIYPCYRYDLKKKEKLKTLYKYYFSNLEFYNLLSSYDEDVYLENKLYLEYLKNNYDVYYVKYTTYEIPFVLIKNKETTLISIDNNINLEKIKGEYIRVNIEKDKLNKLTNI